MDHKLSQTISLSAVVRQIRGIVIITLSTILLFECTYRVILRWAPGVLTSTSPTGLDYGDTWRASDFGPGGGLKENFDSMVLGPYRTPVHWKNNAQGFRNDYDATPRPGRGVVRVLSIGDSFTAGYRLGQDQTYSFLLEQYLKNKTDGNNYEVLISAVDNPPDALDYLSRWGLSFEPKLVLLGLTLGNDVSGAHVRLAAGGKYTLDDETGRLSTNPSPTLGYAHGLEQKLIPVSCAYPSRTPFLDHHSITYHLLKQLWRSGRAGEGIGSWYGQNDPNLRLFDPIHGLGIFLKDPPAEVEAAYDDLFRSLRGLKKLLASKGIDFAVVIFSQRFQVQPEDWTNTVSDFRLNEACFDLNRPNKLIADFCANNNIVCIDPTAAMVASHRTSGRSLYCPRGDMHPNAEGNRVMFEAIKDDVYRRLREDGASRSLNVLGRPFE